MVLPRGADSLLIPLFEELDAIGFGEHKNPFHFNTGTLFWSLTRLFGYYERIMSVLELPRNERLFLDSDIEGFIIRFSIVLNDIAYVIWQLLPEDSRGLKGPKGCTAPKNKEMRIFILNKFLQEHKPTYPELASVLSNALPWMEELKNDRDNVIHYKSIVVILDGEPLCFAHINAARTERIEQLPDGSQRLLMKPITEFINTQLFELHKFMHTELAGAVRMHATRLKLLSTPMGNNHQMTCIGIERFRQINSI